MTRDYFRIVVTKVTRGVMTICLAEHSVAAACRTSG